MTAAAASDVVNSVINNKGVVQARGLVSHNGEIILTGAGAEVTIGGTLDVSGKNGGGKIKIGGDFQGRGSLARAKNTTITSGAKLYADATENGNGGTIIAWSDEFTLSRGAFFARGGEFGGNGGLVETSGKILDANGTTVNTLAKLGSAGYWFLDPDVINITTSGVAWDSVLPATGTSDIDVATINTATSNVVLWANDAININTDISITNPSVSLFLVAGVAGSDIGPVSINGVSTTLAPGQGTISIANQFVRTVGGDVTLLSGKSISVNKATFFLNGVGFNSGGDLTMVSGDVSINNNAAIYTRGGNVTLTAIAAGSGSNKTSGDVNTNSINIDTTFPLSPGIGGIVLTEDGAPLPTGSYGNPGNVFEQTHNGGTITITGKTIGGNSVCFAAGGTGCTVQDPLPATAITITADAKFKTYGDADPLLTYALTSGVLLAGDSIVGDLTRDLGENIGTYNILQGTVTASGIGNYTITYVGALLTINPAPLTITANSTSKTYGDVVTFTGSEFTVTPGMLKFADSVSAVTLTSAGAAATATVAGSPYAIVASAATGTGLSNYTISYVDGALTINKKALTVTADNRAKTYGDTVTFAGTEFTTSGLVNTDSVTLVDLTSAGAPATATVAGSPYAIVASNASGSGLDNYTISYVDGALTVTPATLVVDADDQTKVYGDADPALTYVVTGLQNGESEGAVLSGALNRVAGETVVGGPYAILQNTLVANSNYTLVYVGGNLVITPATLNVVADSKSKPEGAADPALTYAASGFKFKDDAASVLTGSLGRDAGEAAGDYQINQGSVLANSNYVIVYTPNLLTIIPAPAPAVVNPPVPTITFEPLNRPIISYANNVIEHDLPFESFDVFTMNTDVSVRAVGALNSRGLGAAPTLNTVRLPSGHALGQTASASPEELDAIQPAAGGEGNETPAQLERIRPAAGGGAQRRANDAFECGDNFLDDRPCPVQ